jgi:hypothetical protein
MRPAGPLPARVYWVRRALLVVMLLVALSMLWWAAGRLVGGSEDASGAPSAGSAAGGGGSDGTGPAAAATDEGQQPKNDHHPRKHAKPHKPKHHQPVAPSGPCAPTQVDIAVVVHDVKAGHANPVGLRLTSVGTPACTLAITADTLALRITSGSDVVWSSDECPNLVLAREVIVHAHKPVVYTFDWDGRRSTETCAQAGKVAAPGGYWAEAALIGADVHRAYFDVT